MNHYRQFTYMHSACDFLLSLKMFDTTEMHTVDPLTQIMPSLTVVRAAINKIADATDTAYRTRVINGVLFVTRIK